MFLCIILSRCFIGFTELGPTGRYFQDAYFSYKKGWTFLAKGGKHKSYKKCPKGFWQNPYSALRSYFSSVQFSRSVMSNSFRPCGLQHTRLPCPSPIPRAYSNSCPLSRWCHPTISSSVLPFFSCLQSFPASGSFQMSQFFASGGQSTGVSASALVLPLNIQDWFPLGWTG